MTARKNGWTITLPLLLLLVILAVTGMATMSGWRATTRDMEEQLGERIDYSVAMLDDELDRRFSVLEGFSLAFTKENVGDIDQMLKLLVRCAANSEYTYACFAYPDGTLYRNDGAQVQVSHRDYFARSIRGERAVEFVADSPIDRRSSVVTSVPVIVEGKIQGVLVGISLRSEFQTLFERSFSGVNSQTYIIDPEGIIIASTKKIGTVLDLDDTEESIDLIQTIENYGFLEGSAGQIRESMARQEHLHVVYTIQDARQHMNFFPLGVNDWYVAAVLRENQIMEQAMGSVGNVYLILLGVMVAGLVVFVYLMLRARQQTREEKRRSEEMKYRSEHDELTGILVSSAFRDRVEQRLREIRPGEYCLVYMDFYKFKLINEMFGYQKGNELLIALAQDLDEIARVNGGLCARISGDSFVLFIPHEDELIQRFNTKIYREKRIVPLELYLHYGVYVIRDNLIPVDRMIDCAQLAQKTVKGNYGNYVAYFDQSIKESIVMEQEIITSMGQALEDGEFRIYLQPQYNYRTGAVVGAEALVRWISPQRGAVLPGEFIPVFERNGFITRLDEYVWEQACLCQRKWLDQGRTVLPLSVNVSRADLLRGGIARTLCALIQKHGLTADMLRVEITESAYIDDPQKLIWEIEQLSRAGFVVEMDDFGSG